MSRPTQFEIFLPNPLLTFDSSLVRSVLLSFFKRVFAQLPIVTMTFSWYILNFLDLLNCRQRSHASLKRFGHFPGKQFFLCHTNSSVQSHPCLRKANINSITYVWRSPLTAFSFMLRTKVPSGFRTRRNSFARGKNHSTYSFGLMPPYVLLLLSAYGGEVIIKLKKLSGYRLSTSMQSPFSIFVLICSIMSPFSVSWNGVIINYYWKNIFIYFFRAWSIVSRSPTVLISVYFFHDIGLYIWKIIPRIRILI